eukprot:341422-Prymnesium_polylepis.1
MRPSSSALPSTSTCGRRANTCDSCLAWEGVARGGGLWDGPWQGCARGHSVRSRATRGPRFPTCGRLVTSSTRARSARSRATCTGAGGGATEARARAESRGRSTKGRAWGVGKHKEPRVGGWQAQRAARGGVASTKGRAWGVGKHKGPRVG